MSGDIYLAAGQLLIALLNQATQLSATLIKAQAEQRELTAEEWGAILAANGEARNRLVAEIEKAISEGR